MTVPGRMILDSHQHFWHLARTDYGWLTPEMGVLYRNYLPNDLAPLLEVSGVAATVLVQAAPSEAETCYLLDIARNHPFVAAVVGWVDFEAPEVGRRIAALMEAGGGKIKGLRPMIQDLPDPDWLHREDLDAAFDALVSQGLVFDALVRPLHLDALRARLLRHPGLKAVLDHAGKPDIARNGFTEWAESLARLAQDTGLYCKLSGLLTEAGTHTSPADLAPYVQHIFQCFGSERVLWGSDWPVVDSVSDYTQWLALAHELVERFGGQHREKVFGQTAMQLYNIELTHWFSP